MINSDKIIIALDTDNLNRAKQLVKTLYPEVKLFKIGLEFINTGQAPELIKFIHKLGGQVFYDVKLNDIPNTVGRTVNVISKFGVWGFTIHASAGREAIREAIKNKGRSKVIGVMVLTSLANARKNKVIKLAEMLVEEGVDGIVCSAKEVGILKKFKKLIIVPGIRPTWANSNEQKRTATPLEAIKAGADYLVIGRPITDPPRSIGLPEKALERIIKEISL